MRIVSAYQRMAQGLADKRARRREDATDQYKLRLNEPYDCPCCGQPGGPQPGKCLRDKCLRCPDPKCGRVEFKMPACDLRPGQEESCES